MHCSFSSLVATPMITTDPVNQLNVQPEIDVIFMCVAEGDDLVYEWCKDGGTLSDSDGEIDGATTATLTVLNVQDPGDEGTYTCKVSNDVGMDTSSIDAGQLTISKIYQLKHSYIHQIAIH